MEKWQEFVFRSQYYGSHTERGGGDIEECFLFSPEIDISGWIGANFEHGEHSANDEYEKFFAWLDTLKEGKDYSEV
jgi:hypothetical protein